MQETILIPVHAGSRRDELGRMAPGDEIVAHAVVLDDDFSRRMVMTSVWSMSEGYPATRMVIDGVRKKVRLHQIVGTHYHGKLAVGQIWDHEDRDKMNNVPKNLRKVSKSVNSANEKQRRKNNTSGFRGVRRQCQRGGWVAVIQVGGIVKHLGYWKSESEEARRAAARAVNAAYREHFPDVAIPNPEAEEDAAISEACDMVGASQGVRPEAVEAESGICRRG